MALWLTEASGASYYVSTTKGNDSWSGTPADPNASNTDGPFETLARAQTVMQASTTKITTVRGGTYSIASVWMLSWRDDGETWRAYAGEIPVLEGGGTGGISASGVTGLTLEGLTIQNMGATGL